MSVEFPKWTIELGNLFYGTDTLWSVTSLKHNPGQTVCVILLELLHQIVFYKAKSKAIWQIHKV